MKKTSRMIAALLAAVMMFSLTACAEEQTSFLKDGWDGGKEPTTVEEETTLEEETSLEEGAADSEEATDKSTNGTTKKGSSTSSKKPTSNKGSQSSGSQSSGSQSSGNTSTKTTAAAQKTYTAAEAIELYKAAANPIKTKSGVTCTRTREVYTDLGGNLSGGSANIIKSFFGEKDDTEHMTVTGTSNIIEKFVVEKQSYVCNLTASDVKSATVKASGKNKIVTIYVKDDTNGTNYSNKAVSAQAVSDIATGIPLVGLDTMVCKNVRLTATIDANGRLINLNTYMPAYFYSGDEYFGAAIEQWWTISYS